MKIITYAVLLAYFIQHANANKVCNESIVNHNGHGSLGKGWIYENYCVKIVITEYSFGQSFVGKFCLNDEDPKCRMNKWCKDTAYFTNDINEWKMRMIGISTGDSGHEEKDSYSED